MAWSCRPNGLPPRRSLQSQNLYRPARLGTGERQPSAGRQAEAGSANSKQANKGHAIKRATLGFSPVSQAAAAAGCDDGARACRPLSVSLRHAKTPPQARCAASTGKPRLASPCGRGALGLHVVAWRGHRDSLAAPLPPIGSGVVRVVATTAKDRPFPEKNNTPTRSLSPTAKRCVKSTGAALVRCRLLRQRVRFVRGFVLPFSGALASIEHPLHKTRQRLPAIMVGLLRRPTSASEPVSPPHHVSHKSLVLRFSLDQTPESRRSAVVDDVYADDTRLSAQDIRILAERKLSSRSCSLRRALLIQNALPHLGFDSPDRSAEENGQIDRVVSVSCEGRVEDEEAPLGEEFDEARCPSPPAAEEEEVDTSSSSSPAERGNAAEPELDACYQAAMRAFDEFSESDLLLCDAEEAVAVSAASAPSTDGELCAELDVLASVGVACMERQNRVAASPSQVRKRGNPDAEADDAPVKSSKPARSASPCRVTQRVSDAAGNLACSRSVFSVIQCC